MSLTHLTNRERPLFIDGLWRAPDATASIAVLDPCRNEVFATVGTASPTQVEQACEAAASAFPAWRNLSGADRASALEAIAQGLHDRSADLVGLQMLNNGKPRAEAELDLEDAIACFDYYAGLARNLDHTAAPRILSVEGYSGRSRRAPVGPVGLIVPWNFPLVTSAWKLAPALAAGCTAVLKVSEMTPLAELVYGDIAAAIDLPAGVLNILTGLAETGHAIATNPHMAKLSFTGSNRVGAAVMRAASERTLPVSLELGGKSPIVVLSDADTETAAQLVLDGILMNCGQMCSATSRLIVEDGLADRLIEAVVAGAKARLVGMPDRAQMGPVTTAPQYRRVLATFERARAEGANCLVGGTARGDMPGLFVAPTVYDEVPTDSFLWRDELFGPVLSIRRASSAEEAVRLANDTEFGLAATVVAGDAVRALAVAEEIDAGHIWINTPQLILPETMWGGFRASGIGRELGPSGLAAYQQQKFITAPR